MDSLDRSSILGKCPGGFGPASVCCHEERDAPHFVGGALVEVALQGGDDVTTLNRGRTGHDVAGVNLIRADRTNHDELAVAIQAHSWDAAIDTWSGPPLHATVAARLLGPRTSHYGYVSSRSVYSSPITVGLDESHATVDGEPDDTTNNDYAMTKRSSEIGILAARSDALIPRAGSSRAL